ncbi:MAG: EF-P lysine aminoacylase GenX [Proteobacteria bacterium]|nr:EF-P lysine aminoacylase GenX [Pseudomonadota bacterium]
MRLHHQFKLIQSLRAFFHQKGFLETLTPPMVPNPGMETHIHPFKVRSTLRSKDTDYYLHTSPEFCLKELLSRKEENLKNIYSISYCFRDEPESPIHRPQFLMLEWYRLQERYERIMQDVEELVAFCLEQPELPIRKNLQSKKMVRMTMEELWQETIQASPLDFIEKNELKKFIALNHKDVPLPKEDLSWDDYFFLLFLNKVEPKLKLWPLLVVYEFPAPLAALSTLKNAKVCERFEVYINGIELCNAYNELTDPEEQRRRFMQQNQDKMSLYSYSLPEPERFLASLDRGLPPCAGIALGVERLLTGLCEIENPFFY